MYDSARFAAQGRYGAGDSFEGDAAQDQQLLLVRSRFAERAGHEQKIREFGVRRVGWRIAGRQIHPLGERAAERNGYGDFDRRVGQLLGQDDGAGGVGAKSRALHHRLLQFNLPRTGRAARDDGINRRALQLVH